MIPKQRRRQWGEGQNRLIKPRSTENKIQNDENGENGKVPVVVQSILAF
jgi:hypothetical protein